eukprot:scaffold137_cov398-Prasinococcus_capsulatus_cf.AAC.62
MHGAHATHTPGAERQGRIGRTHVTCRRAPPRERVTGPSDRADYGGGGGSVRCAQQPHGQAHRRAPPPLSLSLSPPGPRRSLRGGPEPTCASGRTRRWATPSPAPGEPPICGEVGAIGRALAGGRRNAGKLLLRTR